MRNKNVFLLVFTMQADGTVFMSNSVQRLIENLDKLFLKSMKKQLTIINCNKIECIVDSKRENPKCLLHIGNVKIKQLHEFNYLGCVGSGNEKCHAEILTSTGKTKDYLQKLNKVFLSTLLICLTAYQLLYISFHVEN